MADFTSLVDKGLFSNSFADRAKDVWPRTSRILILVDGRLAVEPWPIPEIGQEFVTSEEFGISVAIRELKRFAQGFSYFAVTVATRDGDGSPIRGHDISGYRFTPESLEKFDQVWMFGIWPDNPGLNPAYDDSEIENPIYNPLSEAELSALAQWMDQGGGVFATGDHDILGASMSHKIPRVAAMRAWTLADGAPTHFGTTRYTTTRPAILAETIGAAVIPFENETDHIPQPIEWVPFSRSMVFERPHPLLCHPQLGPIDILPDHMHEGRCFNFADPAWVSSKRDLTFSFDGYQNAHFPTIAGKRPLPEVVAWGFTPSDPPLKYFEGDQPYRRFPDIAAYDGQQIGLGRVVVDSTWHHWFDLNLFGITKRSIENGDRTVLDKILRYYVNVGIYLAAPGWRAGIALGLIKLNQFEYFGRQMIDLSASTESIGQATRIFLANSLGPCWTMEFVLDQLSERPALASWWRSKLAKPGRTAIELTYQSLEDHVLGETVRALYGDMAELREQIATTGALQSTPLFENMERIAKVAALSGFQQAVDRHAAELEKARAELAELHGIRRHDVN